MRIFLYIFGLLTFTGVQAQQSVIRTLQCYPVGNPFAEPVIELGSGQQIYLAFDDLSEQVNTYTYKVIHCDPDWNNSNLSSFTYLDGFFSNPLDNYNNSFNTQVPYVHYTLKLPNDEVSMKISGNYLLQVFNDNNPDSAVILQRFSVLEPKVGINAEVVNATNPNFLNTSQQLNFSVTYDNLPIYNPIRDVKVYATQNQDPNLRRSFTPTFVRQNQLIYGDGTNNLFNGLSPFRNFQSTSLVYYTQYVKDVLKGPDGLYNFILQPSKVPNTFMPLPDRNGNFYIGAENINNPDVEADYVIVHFAVYYPELIQDADVYIYGKFSGWQLLPLQKMSYDFKNKAYVGQVELKQGYYDYMYAVVPNGIVKPDLVTFQNNFYRNRNDYNIRFYLYDYNQNYYRFIGYQELSSNL